MKKKFCKFCGLELEKNSCHCEEFLESKKNNTTTKKTKKCDTCGKTIDDDSQFCSYCGIPIYANGKNKLLQKELRGIGAVDVLEKYNIKGRARKNDPLVIGMRILTGALVVCFVLMLAYIKMPSLFRIRKNLKNETQKTEEIKETTRENIKESEDETKVSYIQIRDEWIKKDGYFYCFDKDGEPVVDDWVLEEDENGDQKYYYFDVEGKLVVNSWIDGEYYVGADGAMYVDRMTPDGARVDKDGKIIIKENFVIPKNGKETYVYYDAPDDDILNPSTQKSAASGEIVGVDPDKKYDLYISNLIQQREIVIKDDEKCNIIYYCPVIAGEKEKEVEKINTVIIEAFKDNFKTILKKIPLKYTPIPKSIMLNVVEQRNLNENRYMFIISGKTTPREGFPEKVKIRFVYDRKAKTIAILDISDE